MPDPTRFETFLRALPRSIELPDGRRHRLQHVVEFRDPRGYDAPLLELLTRYDVALCLHDMPPAVAPRTLTAALVYVRFHGRAGSYGGGYSRDVLDDWAQWLAGVHRRGTDVYAYFNNDIGGHAPRDAQYAAASARRDGHQSAGPRGLQRRARLQPGQSRRERVLGFGL